MASGETLLKLTDFPFSYSIIGILSGVLGFGISDNYLIFLGIAGAFGTFLTITDPIGWLLRKNEEDRIEKGYDVKHNSNLTLEKQYKISALRTKSINFELEKIVGLFYFIIILALFLAATMPPDSLLFEKLIIKNNGGELLCDILCFKMSYLSISLAALIILVIKANRFWKDLDKKIMIAGYHQIAINDDNATQTSIESMTRAVEQNDWELARIWQGKIKEEIKYKKGKRELIIKAADMVFSLLHKEAVGFETQLKAIPHTRRHPSFDHPEWDKIKQHSHQSIIEDTKLRHRIDSFYNMMYEYNGKLGEVSIIVDEIIKKHGTQVYGQKVVNIIFDVKLNVGGGGRPDLVGCAMQDIHPLDFYHQDGVVREITVRKEDDEETHRDSKFNDSILFDKAWLPILSEVKQNPDVENLKQLFSELKIENAKLMKIYSEKIEMQWKV